MKATRERPPAAQVESDWTGWVTCAAPAGETPSAAAQQVATAKTATMLDLMVWRTPSLSLAGELVKVKRVKREKGYMLAFG